MHELFYFQSALAHLAMALKLLDKLGADVSAAHVDAALESLKLEPAAKRVFPKIVELREADFDLFDKMVIEIYGGEARNASSA